VQRHYITPLQIGVRFCRWKRITKTLDGQNLATYHPNLPTTANDKPVALAGLMGGEETEVQDNTQKI